MQKTEIRIPDHLFIGANTCHGFINLADECFRDAENVYIIKGGPGTGKSTFMEALASEAETRGLCAVRCFCSSDSTSLDGVYIPALGTAVTDGTSPHVMEPKYPGVREHIVSFGGCWNKTWLSAESEAVKRLTDEKSELFQAVYKYLGVCRGLRDERKRIAASFTDTEKAEQAVKRIIGKLGRSSGFRLINAQMTSLGMNGRTHLDSFRRLSGTVYRLCDKRGISHCIFDRIVKYSEDAGLTVLVSRDPMLDIDALCLPEKGVCFIGYGEENSFETDRIINTERFVIKDKLSAERRRLRFIRGVEDELNSRVDEIFRKIRSCHFALESIYKCAMDFDKKNAILASVADEIFGNAR